MLAENESGIFIESAIEQMAAYTLPYLTQVSGVIDEHTGEFRGTGFFCELAGREAIVTADHVRQRRWLPASFGAWLSRGEPFRPAIVEGEIRSSDRIRMILRLLSV